MLEKLKTLIQYFHCITEKMPEGVVSFSRHSKKISQNRGKNIGYSNVIIKANGLIEDEGKDYVQIDFANKRIGGGVIGKGCIQEEIQFLLHPELIVSKMICEEMADDECIVITGAQRFAGYRGYGSSYKYAAPYHDKTPRDGLKRKMFQLVAMDAKHYRNPQEQYSRENITREMLKAYCAFSSADSGAIATGNWGCGFFNGNPELKFIIQLLAAAEAEKDLMYFTCDQLQPNTQGGPPGSVMLRNVYEATRFFSPPELCDAICHIPQDAIRRGDFSMVKYLHRIQTDSAHNKPNRCTLL